ncbi:hypothetical protein BST12_09520 [Mycobacterium angelicum]|uniref:Uncharacterized protein n=1 Tax=Mycobacterium angelicum TaxID=470074 RepID=A0A1W9ZXN4_MYCAN|nr:hypothetical protein BST12_09520 [Mycobacterium angelicum]
MVALSGAEIPEWLRQLSVPAEWQLVQLPDNAEQPMARMAVRGLRGDGEWEAADSISVFGYTGWPVFYDVFHHADGMLRALAATGITVKALPVPPIERTAAMRSSGTVLTDDQSVWIQQSHYLAGSEALHASRLIVHTLFVDAASRARLAEDIIQLSDAVYQGFIATVLKEFRPS